MKRILAVLLAMLMLAGLTAFAMAEDATEEAEAPATEEAAPAAEEAEAPAAEEEAPAAEEAEAPAAAEETPATEEAEAPAAAEPAPATEEAEAPAAEEPAPATEEAEAPAEETAFEVLQNGSRGDMVVTLQKKLKELGYRVGTADGIFGPRTEKGLKAFQADMGWEETGTIADQATLDSILSLIKGDGVNLVWDGQFKDVATYWKKWGKPLMCESVEENGKTWLHIITSGTKNEGMRQDIEMRSGDVAQVELVAGETYIFSFTAYGAEESVGKSFRCLVQNMDAVEKKQQENYWTATLQLTAEPTTYSVAFVPTVDGTINVAIGTGRDEAIEAWFSDVKVEKGNIATEWSESPNLK